MSVGMQTERGSKSIRLNPLGSERLWVFDDRLGLWPSPAGSDRRSACRHTFLPR